jgi:hypothetical protein
LSRRGRSSPANASGLDTHRDSISSRFYCSWAELFEGFDTDGSGLLNLAEMYMCVRQGAGMTEKTISNCARCVFVCSGAIAIACRRGRV